MTDAFSSFSPAETIVIRFNGGTQAGHTVVSFPDNRRHVFGHLGSGTLVGAKTYLSEHFVVNPFLFKKELVQLVDLKPTVIFHPKCLVTTPYDMIINHIAETHRGNARHGSCGLGVNETVTRALGFPESAVKVSDLRWNSYFIRETFLKPIRNKWVPERLKALGLEPTQQEHDEMLNNEGLIQGWLDDVLWMMNHEAVWERYLDSNPKHYAQIDILNKTLVFEGAQGLMLDQHYGAFPYVTRSSTGLQNVVQILRGRGINDAPIDVTYVTRAYATRHGAGPFPRETDEQPYAGIAEQTNVTNQYQGSFRYGLLDLNVLADAINHDLKYARGFQVNKQLAVTCLDQVGDTHRYYVDDTLKEGSETDFLADVSKTTGITNLLYGRGPTRKSLGVLADAVQG